MKLNWEKRDHIKTIDSNLRRSFARLVKYNNFESVTVHSYVSNSGLRVAVGGSLWGLDRCYDEFEKSLGKWCLEYWEDGHPSVERQQEFNFLEESFVNPLKPTSVERALWELETGIEYPFSSGEVTL